MILTAFGGWGAEHLGHEDADLLDPEHIFSLISVLGGVIGAWLGQELAHSETERAEPSYSDRVMSPEIIADAA